MPMKFNQKEMTVIAMKPKEEFDMEGVLAMREEDGKLFLKTGKYTERLFRLKGNLLFYFKAPEKDSEVVGVIVLDQCFVDVTHSNREFSFAIDCKDCDDGKFELAAESREKMNEWINMLNQARYEATSQKLYLLRDEIMKMCGEDPLPDYPAIEQENIIRTIIFGMESLPFGGSLLWNTLNDEIMEQQLQALKERSKPGRVNSVIVKFVKHKSQMTSLQHSEEPLNSLDDTKPMMELCIACTNLANLQDVMKPTLIVKIFVMSPTDHSWSRHSQTELCEDSREPFFLKTVVFDSKFSSPTRLKIVLYDVRNRSKNFVIPLGQAVCTLQDIQQAPRWRISLVLRNLESNEEVGNLVLQGWIRQSGNSFARRQNSMEFIQGYGSRTTSCLDEFPRTFVGPVCERSFYYQTSDGEDIKFQELMGESLLSFKLPCQLLHLLIKEEKEAVVELNKLGKLQRRLDVIKNQQQDEHFDLVSLYSETLSELKAVVDRNFKRSAEKCEKDLEFVTTNLHIQRVRVIETNKEEFCYDTITFGAPAAHSQKFKLGGLNRIMLTAQGVAQRGAESSANADTRITVKKAKNMKSVLKEAHDVIESLCNKIPSLDTYELKSTADLLSNKIADVLNIVSSSFVRDAEKSLESSRGAGQPENDSDNAWQWNGSEFKEIDTKELSDQVEYDCGLRDDLVLFMSLINSPEQDFQRESVRAKVVKSASRLSNTVRSFIKKFNVIMRFTLMKEYASLGTMTKEIRYRRDIVFSQVLAPVIAGFVIKLSEKIHSPMFLEQLAKVGLLVHFESLITAHGDEMGMLEDAIIAFHDLTKVKLKFILDDSLESYPSLEGDRSEVIVSFPLESSHFKALPEDLRNGALVYLHPIVFNVGINEHATIAERFGDMSIQDNMNCENLNLLHSYYEKFSSYFPKWQGTRSESFTSLAMLMAHLQVVVNSKKSKNIEIFHLSEEICRRMNGIRLTSCKSAKDRTAMAVTLEAARILQKEHRLPPELFLRMLSTMRSQGTRLVNSMKNVGIPKYAFNRMQVRAYPAIYRAPEGTYGKSIPN